MYEAQHYSFKMNDKKEEALYVHILACSINYEKTPIKVREKLSFSDGEIDLAMKQLRKEEGIVETVLFSTCNRTEIYIVVDDLDAGRHDLSEFIATWFHVHRAYFERYLLIKENEEAIEHIFRLTSGLESMVIGETQILGQVRNSFLRAQQLNMTGTIFNELFKRAITMAKRAHQHTEISAHAVSISYAAVELAKKIYGELSSKRVVIIGAGEMAQLAIRHLQSAGVRSIQIINRTFEHAEHVASTFNVEAVPFDQIYMCMNDADICISSTAASGPILMKAELSPVVKKRKGNPLFLLDIAVPRDVEGSVREIDGAFLYDVDDLQHIVDHNLETRKEAAAEIETVITSEIRLFKEWVITRGAVPILAALREKGIDIQSSILQSIHQKMPDLTNREKELLEKHTSSIITQLLKEPILQTKKMATNKDSEQLLSVVIELFGMDEKVHEQAQRHLQKNEHYKESFSEESTAFPFIRKIVPR